MCSASPREGTLLTTCRLCVYQDAMRFPLSSFVLLNPIAAVLSFPRNLSIHRLPSNTLSQVPVWTNTSLLGDWPEVPWTMFVEGQKVIFDQYGREADDYLRAEVVDGIQLLREHFLEVTIEPRPREIRLEAGIVNFSIGFTGRQLLTGEEISEALRPLEVFYADETWALREIVNAQIGTLGRWVPLGAFQVLFDQLAITPASRPWFNSTSTM